MLEDNIENRVSQVFQDTDQMLYTANIGLQLMAEDNSKTVGAGLRIAVVFGRHVTNGLQRLRSLIPEFNDWYAHYVNEMKNDELMKYGRR